MSEPKKLSLAEAASALEAVCDRISESDEYDVHLQTAFSEALTELSSSVDKRISFLLYLDGAIEQAKTTERMWQKRRKILERMLGRLKEYTLQAMLMEPNIYFRGHLGELKIRTAGIPKMYLKGVLETVDGKFIAETDEGMLKDLYRYKRFLKPGFMLDRGLLKDALERGEIFPDAMIEKSKSVQVKI